MPPKKENKKQTQQRQKKAIEDKTFGLKNKNKSKKVQQYVQNIERTVKTAGKNPRQLALEQQAREARKLAKQADEMMKQELGSLFKAVADVKVQKVSDNVDPKTVLCAFFKAGACKRGAKCKFSHDIGMDRKVAKLNVYSDPREADTMDKWDQEKLERVVAEKHGRPENATDIICKYFLDAIEQRKYGWLWECPNGRDCKYRHCLPPGYVFKSAEEKTRPDEEEEVPDISEEIEEERAKLDISKCTPVTLETFNKWKEQQRAKKEAEILAKAQEVAKQGGKAKGLLSGRALFTFDPSLFVDDDEAAGNDAYEFEEHKPFDEDEEAKREKLFDSDGDLDGVVFDDEEPQGGEAKQDAGDGDGEENDAEQSGEDEEEEEDGENEEQGGDEHGEEDEEEEQEEAEEAAPAAPPAPAPAASSSAGGKGRK